MSAFGRDTFQQKIYEDIIERLNEHNTNALEELTSMLVVVAYLVNAAKTDERMYERIKNEVMEEIYLKLGTV